MQLSLLQVDTFIFKQDNMLAHHPHETIQLLHMSPGLQHS